MGQRRLEAPRPGALVMLPCGGEASPSTSVYLQPTRPLTLDDDLGMLVAEFGLSNEEPSAINLPQTDSRSRTRAARTVARNEAQDCYLHFDGLGIEFDV